MKFALAILVALTNADALPSPYYGYYAWNWGAGSTGTSVSNSGVAFTGLNSVADALAAYTPGTAECCPALKKPSMLSLGGGNDKGIMSKDILDAIDDDAI